MDNNGAVKTDKAHRTRERLLKSSLKLMKEKGYQNTTIREICHDAKVSIGTFYSYFPAKEDLFLHIYMDGDRYFTDSVAINLSGRSAPDQIVDFFRYYTRLNLNTGLELMKILYQSDNKFFSRYRPMQKVLEDIVQEGINSGELKTDMLPRDIVDFFFVLARGCCYNWCITDGSYDLEHQITEYVSIAVKALL